MRLRAGEVAELDDTVRDIDARLGEVDRERKERRGEAAGRPGGGLLPDLPHAVPRRGPLLLAVRRPARADRASATTRSPPSSPPRPRVSEERRTGWEGADRWFAAPRGAAATAATARRPTPRRRPRPRPAARSAAPSSSPTRPTAWSAAPPPPSPRGCGAAARASPCWPARSPCSASARAPWPTRSPRTTAAAAGDRHDPDGHRRPRRPCPLPPETGPTTGPLPPDTSLGTVPLPTTDAPPAGPSTGFDTVTGRSPCPRRPPRRPRAPTGRADDHRRPRHRSRAATRTGPPGTTAWTAILSSVRSESDARAAKARLSSSGEPAGRAALVGLRRPAPRLLGALLGDLRRPRRRRSPRRRELRPQFPGAYARQDRGLMADGRRAMLITGASSGIGAATARARRGRRLRVVLAARSVDRLEALAAELGGPDAGARGRRAT